MNILIVYAHPESKSFNGALLNKSISVLRGCGHEVQVSDLYTMKFNPIASTEDFRERRFPEALQYDREQKYAYERGHFAPDIKTEIDKLLWCDFLILQFPLWWYSVPAILKGWFDRVLVNGVAYGKGKRLDAGGLKGRKAMLSFTTGCYSEMVEPDGLLGDLEVNLWHLNHGTLYYSGFEVLPPFAAWSIHYTTLEQREDYLEQYAERLRTFEVAEAINFHKLSEFGSDWKLKPDVAPRTVAHRRLVTGGHGESMH